MNAKDLEKHKKALEKEMKELEGNLKTFAKKDPAIAGDWDSTFPSFGDTRSEQDENADEVEEYENRVGLEHELELRLVDIERALAKIKNEDNYGHCEKCGKVIDTKRLTANPEARYCADCMG